MDATKTHYPHHPRQNMVDFVPDAAKKIADIGCHTGAFGETLKSVRLVEVWGVEPNPEAAQKASRVLDTVLNANFDRDVALPDGSFDALTFNDVLEHLQDPWEALRIAATKLRPGGCVIASIPNVRQIDNLLHILRDRDFRYETLGIRDRTHLRFFTAKSMARLFEESGYTVVKVVGINESWWSPSILRRLLFVIFGKYLDDTKYMQFAVVATPNCD
jgi:2-polyprenyl-3-methyl-5-hydroxy-6-metoxy-1,4-benzoquinol methylase